MPKPFNFQFVPSIIIGGKKFRAVGDRIYTTSPYGTFHQFLGEYAMELIGDHWWIDQESKHNSEQSCLFKWANEFYTAASKIRTNNPKGKLVSIPNTGTRLCWMLFCYDLLCLKHRFALQKELIKRLKINQSFQGARYELAIAAMLVRSDFNIEWIRCSNKRTCELIATHRKTPWSFGVEVKSKHYSGIMNTSGQKAKYNSQVSGLLKKALTQAPINMGYVIFIDLNSDGLDEARLMDQANSALKICIKESSENEPDLFSLIIFTNFSFHYLDDGVVKYSIAAPFHPKYPIPMQVQEAISDGLHYYNDVPNEV